MSIITDKVVGKLYGVLEITKEDVLVTQHYEANETKEEMQSIILKGFVGKETIVISFYSSGNLIAVRNQKVNGKWTTIDFVTDLDELKTLINSRSAGTAKIDMTSVLA